ncbi:hypothetical protein [Pseudidiomarina taiwanensis]|uniref:hypothetical protein n=1 Tax=Pseudidiomarina taiwanensis TaxID=337250 RepID=UPI0013006416|nr:hypothetical protein [Pseudidiomarina taiwanensis]
MISALIIAVIGFAVMLSGIWEQQLWVIILGVFMQLFGVIWFRLSWNKQAREDNNNNE